MSMRVYNNPLTVLEVTFVTNTKVAKARSCGKMGVRAAPALLAFTTNWLIKLFKIF
jgi:hypothetical protein